MRNTDFNQIKNPIKFQVAEQQHRKITKRNKAMYILSQTNLYW